METAKEKQSKEIPYCEYLIYMHTSPSGKRYIGITKQKLENRWGKNGERYKKCTLFWKAIQKYGWDKISHEIIDTAISLEEANKKEREYISLYKSNDNDYGYNCTRGGDGVSGWKPSVEQRFKNSKSKIEMWNNQEIRDRLTEERRKRSRATAERERLRQCSISNWANEEMRTKLNKHLTEISRNPECKEKRSQKLKELWENDKQRFMKNRTYRTGAESSYHKAVRCIELNKIFPTAREANKETGVSYKDISSAAHKKRKTAGGYHWEFTDNAGSKLGSD